MATPTEVTTEMDVPITVAVPVVQDSHEKPYKADDKYLLQATRILLAKLSSGQEQEITVDMLRKETHHQWRLDYNRWNKKHNRALNRAKALRARDAKDAALLAQLGLGPPPSPLALSSPPLPLARSFPLTPAVSPLVVSPTSFFSTLTPAPSAHEH